MATRSHTLASFTQDGQQAKRQALSERLRELLQLHDESHRLPDNHVYQSSLRLAIRQTKDELRDLPR
jgi:hypothetical protein